MQQYMQKAIEKKTNQATINLFVKPLQTST